MKSLLLMATVAAGTAMADPSVVISGTNFVNDTVVSVDLTIGGLVAGKTNQLWVTYGPAAAGEEPADWQVCAYVQDVTNESSVLNLAMPEGWGVSAKAIRFYLVPKSPLYDFQYEYMDSSGTQYLNTLCTHTANVRLKTKFAVLSNPVGSYNAPFGSRSTSSAYKGALVFFTRYGGSPQARFGRGDGSSEKVDTGNPLPFDTPVELGVDGTSVTWSGGGKTRTFSASGSATAGFAPMFVFSLNETATVGGATVNAACTMKMRLYSFRMDDGDTPLCEIVPVIKDNVLMGYDRVSKTLLPNAGTGAFTTSGARQLIDRSDVTAATDALVVPEERAIVIAGTNTVDGVVTSLDLSFSAATPGDTRTSALYVTYGRCPGGESTDGWDQCVRVAEIKPDINAYTYAVPAGWGKDVRAIRFFLAAVPAEYDSAISYRESTGLEWINTEVTHTTSTTIDCELELMSNPIGAYNTPFGSRRNNYSQGCYLFTRYGGTQKPRFCFGKEESVGSTGTLPSGVPLAFRLAGNRDCRWGLLASHEALGRLSTVDASTKDGFAPMLLFTMNETGTEGDVSPNTACNTKMRLRSFKMFDSPDWYSRTMCDLIPVRKGMVGYLYDRVTKRLLANGSGVGAFVCGPDCYGGELLRSSSATFAWHAPAPKASTARYQSLVTFKGHSGKEPIARFPALLRLSPSRIAGFSYDQCETGGADIRIYDLQGELLPHEIDTWNPSGESHRGDRPQNSVDFCLAV